MNTTLMHATRRGSALLTTFLLVMFVALAGAGMYQYSSQQIFSVARTRDYLRAKVIAEAGANQAYNRMRYDFSARNNAANFPLTSFGGGTYDVTVTSVSSNKARLVSVGTCGLAESRVSADLLNTPRTRIEWSIDDQILELSVFTNHSILVGGTISWGGNGMILNGGDVRSNSKMSFTGGGTLQGPYLRVYSSMEIYLQGSSKIIGNTFAPKYSGTANITGTKTTVVVPFTAIPNIDLTTFYQRALTNNEVKSGTFSPSIGYSPVGGVVWVNGNIKIPNGSFNGCFIATGDIDMSTAGTMGPVNGYPLLISRDGTIKVTGTPTVSGLIYARGGSVDWQGGGQLNGSIVATGGLNKGGGSDLIINFSPVSPVVPGMPVQVTNSTDYVRVSAWQE